MGTGESPDSRRAGGDGLARGVRGRLPLAGLAADERLDGLPPRGRWPLAADFTPHQCARVCERQAGNVDDTEDVNGGLAVARSRRAFRRCKELNILLVSCNVLRAAEEMEV